MNAELPVDPKSASARPHLAGQLVRFGAIGSVSTVAYLERTAS